MDKHSSDETIDELRQKLNNMKRAIAERQRSGNLNGNNSNRKSDYGGVIDSSFLSFVFGIALVVIVTVSIYAFYNLYHAILKKFPSHHEEL